MSITLYIKRLRAAADALENLLESEPANNKKAADAIVRSAARETKVHWTKTEAGKKRLARAMKKSWRKRHGATS